jgi:DNA recombination protein RmuC
MLGVIGGVVAAFVGILVGFWLKAVAGKAEKAQLELRALELANELSVVRSELARTQAESAARAGFESLATEREKAIGLLAVERERLREDLAAKNTAEAQALARVSGLEAELNAEHASLAEKVALLDDARKTVADQFEALAGRILDEKSKTFSDDSQKELGTLLTPLKTQIEEFRKKVEEAQKESLIGRTELSSELKQLRSLNENLSSEAHSLSTALRQDTQKQGHWGEFILLKILENSGLKRGEHYTYQESFSTEDEESGQDRRRQTDVVVKLPEGRHLIIDSKVTLRAHDDYVSAINDNERDEALKRLLKSFHDHYKGLADRNYHRISKLQSPDFVVLFAPVEPAFMLAVQKDESLWTDAYQRGVLLAGPTTVLFVLRIVENLWKQEQQNKNVQKVMDRGGKLYDKFVGFVEDLEAVGDRISDAGQSYKEALRKLTTGRENLVRQVEMLRELGLEPKKKLKPKLLEAAGADEILPLVAIAASDSESDAPED